MRWLAALLALSATATAEYPAIGHVERHSPALDAILAPDAVIEKLCEGFGFAEGPVWKDGALLFSDIPKNAIMQWKEGDAEAAVFLQPSGWIQELTTAQNQGSNGLALDARGRLLICQHGERRIARLDPAGQTELIKLYDGHRLNSPNDLAVRRNGDIYFTDPPYGLAKLSDSPMKEQAWNGVYRLTPEGKLTLLIKDLTFPNGIAFSPDEKTLYVNVSDPEAPRTMAYDVAPDGSVAQPRIFCQAAPGRLGIHDGLKVDAAGNVFTTAPGGLQIFSPGGEFLGALVTETVIANCAWGDDGSTLYLTAGHLLCRIKTKTRGDRFPAVDSK